MLQIENTLISFDILDKKFCCEISKCLGQCCVEGDSGAPLNETELPILEEIFPKVKSYLTQKGIEVIEKVGFYVKDETDNTFVTPLIDNSECAYCFFEKNVARCAIEKAFFASEISFQKPISCHLFPIRIRPYYGGLEALNYQQLKICSSAREKGKLLQLYLYQVLKEPLIRKFGKDWYEQLEFAANHFQKNM